MFTLPYLTSTSIVHYADDSTVYMTRAFIESLTYNANSVYMTRASIESLTYNGNSELRRIECWLCANKLSLNVTKSQYYTLHDSSNSNSIKVRGQLFPQTTHIKISDSIIANNIYFASQIELVIT